MQTFTFLALSFALSMGAAFWVLRK